MAHFTAIWRLANHSLVGCIRFQGRDDRECPHCTVPSTKAEGAIQLPGSCRALQNSSQRQLFDHSFRSSTLEIEGLRSSSVVLARKATFTIKRQARELWGPLCHWCSFITRSISACFLSAGRAQQWKLFCPAAAALHEDLPLAFRASAMASLKRLQAQLCTILDGALQVRCSQNRCRVERMCSKASDDAQGALQQATAMEVTAEAQNSQLGGTSPTKTLLSCARGFKS